jgi:hypothetical protein
MAKSIAFLFRAIAFNTGLHYTMAHNNLRAHESGIRFTGTTGVVDAITVVAGDLAGHALKTAPPF